MEPPTPTPLNRNPLPLTILYTYITLGEQTLTQVRPL